jgi:hypothetical protein
MSDWAGKPSMRSKARLVMAADGASIEAAMAAPGAGK